MLSINPKVPPALAIIAGLFMVGVTAWQGYGFWQAQNKQSLEQSATAKQPIAEKRKAPTLALSSLEFFGTASTDGESVEESTEDLPWFDLAKTRLALADYYAYVESYNRARRIYMQVWESLSGDEDQLAMRAELLERPVTLRRDQLPGYAGGRDDTASDPGEFLTGTIRVDYTVSERGRVRNLRTEANPPEFTDMQRMVHREVRRRLFRPKLVDGVPVQSDNQVFVHEFYYRQERLDELRREKELEAQSGNRPTK